MNERVRAAPLAVVPLGNRERVVMRLGHGACEVVPFEIVNLLAKCTAFSPIEEQAASVWRSLSLPEKLKNAYAIAACSAERTGSFYVGRSAFPKMLTEIFSHLQSRGMFISRDELFGKGAEENESSITTIGIVTKDRPDALKRCIESYAAHLRSHEEKGAVLVCDSSSAAARGQNISTVEAVSKTYGCNASYFGLEEKHQLIKDLEGEGIEPELAEFAIIGYPEFGNDCGANRNSLLLAAIGERVLSVDDDTICLPAVNGDIKSHLKVGSLERSLVVKSFPSRQEVEAAVRADERSHFALHGKYLGRELKNLLATLPPDEGMDLTEATAAMLYEVERNRAKIVLTIPGLYGDSATAHPYAAMFYDTLGEQAAPRSEDELLKMLKSREIIKGVDQPVVHAPSLFMSTFVGIDNRLDLPPFFPMFRNQDAVFGEMMAKFMPYGMFAHLPSLLLHSPLETRKSAVAAHGTAVTKFEPFWPSETIRSLLGRWTPSSAQIDPYRRMEEFGRILVSAGSLNWNEYRILFTEIWTTQITDRIGRLEFAMSNDKPKFWRKHAKAITQGLKDQFKQLPHLAPPPMIERLGKEEAEKRTKRLIQQFGELLIAWPAIREAVHSLKKRGMFQLR